MWSCVGEGLLEVSSYSKKLAYLFCCDSSSLDQNQKKVPVKNIFFTLYFILLYFLSIIFCLNISILNLEKKKKETLMSYSKVFFKHTESCLDLSTFFYRNFSNRFSEIVIGCTKFQHTHVP